MLSQQGEKGHASPHAVRGSLGLRGDGGVVAGVEGFLFKQQRQLVLPQTGA